MARGGLSLSREKKKELSLELEESVLEEKDQLENRDDDLATSLYQECFKERNVSFLMSFCITRTRQQKNSGGERGKNIYYKIFILQ